MSRQRRPESPPSAGQRMRRRGRSRRPVRPGDTAPLPPWPDRIFGRLAVTALLGRPDKRQDLLGAQHVDLRRAANARSLDDISRVARQAVDLHRPLEDRAEADEVLLAGPVGASVAADPELDVLRGDPSTLRSPNSRTRTGPCCRSRAASRLAVADVLAVGEPLLRGVAEGLAGLHHSGQRSLAGLCQQLVQMGRRLRLGEVAVGRRGLLRPGRPEPFLLLPTSGSRYFAYQTTPRFPLRLKTCPEIGRGRGGRIAPPIVARFGTNSGQSLPDSSNRTCSICLFRGLFHGAGWTRTSDRRIMSPLL